MGARRRQSARPRPGRSRKTHWSKLPHEQLLDVRMCDLDLSIEGTELQERVDELHEEMAVRGLRFQPLAWLSDEWFAPPESPGIAVPFYLAHPRLKRLERRMMWEVEGGSRRDCMKLLRHEAGHAVQFAYALHRRKRWQQMFGRSTQKYPDAYQPRPYSRRYVLHIDNHYAQAHPDEDFAETFAVWLTPGNNWRRRYASWPALKKLEYVDALMHEIADETPVLRTRRTIHPLRSIRITLREHYAARQERYGLEEADVYTRDLRRLFDESQKSRDPRPLAAAFLRKRRRDLLKLVQRWTGSYQYTINDVYTEMIERCREHRLRVPADVDEAELDRQLAVMLAVQVMTHLHNGGHWIKL